MDFGADQREHSFYNEGHLFQMFSMGNTYLCTATPSCASFIVDTAMAFNRKEFILFLIDQLN